jgi:hypothetical protein
MEVKDFIRTFLRFFYIEDPEKISFLNISTLPTMLKVDAKELHFFCHRQYWKKAGSDTFP